MTATTAGGERAFKRAVIFSAVLHAALFVLMVTSPSLPKPAGKGMIHYVSMSYGLPGGGGSGGPGGSGGGGGTSIRSVDAPQPLPPARKEMLRDLTTPQNIQTRESETVLRHPVDKPKRDRKPPTEKKAAISKAPPDAKSDRTDAGSAAAAGTGGTGSGLRIGVGDGTGGGGGGGGGFGPGFGGGGGTGFFPHAYYVQIVYDRVSASWFTSLVDPGVTGSFSATVTFRIFRNGRISDLKISESSGLPSLDLSALRAIQTASPFPALPPDYDGEHIVFHIIFEHNK